MRYLVALVVDANDVSVAVPMPVGVAAGAGHRGIAGHELAVGEEQHPLEAVGEGHHHRRVAAAAARDAEGAFAQRLTISSTTMRHSVLR